MRNAVLLNAAKKKRKKPKKAKKKKAKKAKKVHRNVVGDGRRGPGTPAQQSYRALVKRHLKRGSTMAAAAREWNSKSGRAAANKMRMPAKWKAKTKAGARKTSARSVGSAWSRGVASWNMGRKKNPAATVLLKEAVTLKAMKAGVPVIFSALSGYFVPFYLMQRYPTKVKGLVRHAIGVGTATVAGAATALLTKSGVLGLASFMSALGGYLIPTVGVKVMAKLLPEPSGTAGFGQGVDEAIEAGIQKAMRETGLAQASDLEESIYSAEEQLRLGRTGQIISEKQVAQARQLSPTASGLSQIVGEEEVAEAPELSPTVGEFGLGMRGLI